MQTFHLAFLIINYWSLQALGQVISIGVVLNLASPVQISGVALLNFTANELNAQNALPYPIQIVVRDSNNSIRQSILHADKLVNEMNIVALIGEFRSGLLMLKINDQKK